MAKRSGKNRLVLVASMQAYLDSLPDAREVPAEPAYRSQLKSLEKANAAKAGVGA